MCLFTLLTMLPLWLVGAVVFFHLAKGMKPPADTSNRIAHLRLVWFALTRPQAFVDLFPWLTKDEWRGNP